MENDPIGFGGGDDNLYAYLANNPTDLRDAFGLMKATAKCVGEGPQTGFNNNGQFSGYWGVGIYLSQTDMDALAKLGGGFIVVHRKITWKFSGCGDCFNDQQQGKLEAWFLDPITFADGKPVTSGIYNKPIGGPRPFQGGATPLSYISAFLVENNPCKKGEITVEVDWKLYGGAPGANVADQFPHHKPNFNQPDDIPKGFCYDEYIHKPWTDKAPDIKGKPLDQGSFDGTVTWDNGKDSFKKYKCDGLPGGPQRRPGAAQFPPWTWDPGSGSWIRKE